MRHPEWRLLGLVFVLAGTLSACVTTGIHSSGGKSEAAKVHTELGQAYFAQGNYEDAEEKLKKALEFDSHYEPAHTVLAALYDRLKRPELAGEHYLEAAKLSPKSGDVNNNYAVYLCRQGKAKEAMPYFDKAMDDPFYRSPVRLLTNAGICSMDAGEYDLAKDKLSKALDEDSKNPSALYQMARLLSKTGDNFHANAYIQRYLSHAEANPEVLNLAYHIETELGNRMQADRYRQQLKQEFPEAKESGDL